MRTLMICTPQEIKLRRDKLGMQHIRGRGEGAYRVLVGKPEGKRPLGRPRNGWEDNIKMDLQEVGWGA
jgi:hypothetical protein